jgi:hypothetical protein
MVLIETLRPFDVKYSIKSICPWTITYSLQQGYVMNASKVNDASLSKKIISSFNVQGCRKNMLVSARPPKVSFPID